MKYFKHMASKGEEIVTIWRCTNGEYQWNTTIFRRGRKSRNDYTSEWHDSRGMGDVIKELVPITKEEAFIEML